MYIYIYIYTYLRHDDGEPMLRDTIDTALCQHWVQGVRVIITCV